MSNTSCKKIFLSALFIGVIFASSLFSGIAIAEISTKTSQTISSFGSILPSNPTQTNQIANGIWCQPEDPTPSQCSFWLTHDIKEIYLQCYRWRTDGSVEFEGGATGSMISTSIANAHAAGMRIYAWIITDLYAIDLSDAAKRQNAVNTLKTILSTYNFDGIVDNIETLSPWNPIYLDTFDNLATVQLNAMGKEFFETMVLGSWYEDPSHLAELQSIRVNKLIPMLYLQATGSSDNSVWMTYARFKADFDYLLRNCESPVQFALIAGEMGGANVLSHSMTLVDEQIAVGTPLDKLVGFSLLWQYYMDSTEWSQWSAWSTKG